MKSKTTQHNTALHRMRFRRIGELFVGSRNLKSFSALALLCLVSIGCSQKPPQAPSVALPNGLQSRFEDYCDYTGGLGIGFVAWHTYDYRFRQHLKRTQDPELKRLYVLENLHRGTAVAIDNLETDQMQTGRQPGLAPVTDPNRYVTL
jgi:hypothetical protein